MSQQFQLAGGSMIGRDHRNVPKNNQDSWGIWRTDELSVAIVADGCGSGRHSEVGAKLGVQILGSYLQRECADVTAIKWRRAQQALVSQLDVLARTMGSDYRKVVEDYFLFTLVGLIIDTQNAVFFALGDGMIVINGQPMELGPFPGNMPPYVGYNLVADRVSIAEEDLKIRPVVSMRTDELESFVIATDGFMDIVRHEHDNLPGLENTVGSISDFWQNDRYFRGNPELLSRQLKLIGRDWPNHNPEPGLLSDDTTLVVGRRNPESERTDK